MKWKAVYSRMAPKTIELRVRRRIAQQDHLAQQARREQGMTGDGVEDEEPEGDGQTRR